MSSPPGTSVKPLLKTFWRRFGRHGTVGLLECARRDDPPRLQERMKKRGILFPSRCVAQQGCCSMLFLRRVKIFVQRPGRCAERNRTKRVVVFFAVAGKKCLERKIFVTCVTSAETVNVIACVDRAAWKGLFCVIAFWNFCWHLSVLPAIRTIQKALELEKEVGLLFTFKRLDCSSRFA